MGSSNHVRNEVCLHCGWLPLEYFGEGGEVTATVSRAEPCTVTTRSCCVARKRYACLPLAPADPTRPNPPGHCRAHQLPRLWLSGHNRFRSASSKLDSALVLTHLQRHVDCKSTGNGSEIAIIRQDATRPCANVRTDPWTTCSQELPNNVLHTAASSCGCSRSLAHGPWLCTRRVVVHVVRRHAGRRCSA